MGRTSTSDRASGDKDALLSNVALLYYGEGLTQGEIAKRMRVSRATIVNVLRESRERGIVNIRVNGRYLTGSGLSRDVRDKFGLADVYVAQIGEGASDAPRSVVLPQLARVASAAILDIVEPGDRIGVAWGETVMAIADVMPRTHIDDVEVRQLIGSKITSRVPASENCTIQIANKLGAMCYTLHAPGLVSTTELADTFRAEPTIRAQLRSLEHLDATIASIGHVEEDTHLVAAEMATARDLAAARKAGAVGILCCRFIDADGAEIATPPHDRLIGARIGNLRAAKKRLLAVCGRDRGTATLAAIRGGLVTHLCVDQGLAEFLLDA